MKKELILGFGDGIAFFFIKLNYAFKNKFIHLVSKLFFGNLRKEEINKILVLRIGSMGDTITALPAFTAIKNNFPHAQIDLLTNKFQPGKAFVFEILPDGFFTEYIYYEKFVDESIIKRLLQNKYDLFIELPTYRVSVVFELRSILMAKTIKCNYGIGWHTSSDQFLTKKQEELLIFDPNRVRLLEILKQYGFQSGNTGYLLESNSVILPNFDFDKIYKSEQGKRRIIALVTGAGSINKKWPLKDFQLIAKYFADDNYLVLLIGGVQDFIEGELVAKGYENIINLCGKLTVLENAVVLKKCDLIISNDTGPMHLAYAVGTPVIGIFSAQDYEGKWYPPENGINVVLRAKNRDTSQISVEQVLTAAYQILDPGNGKAEV